LGCHLTAGKMQQAVNSSANSTIHNSTDHCPNRSGQPFGQPSSHGGISSMLLEVLHLALVLLRFFKSGKCTQVAPLACRIALFSGIQAIFAGF
jgi:hypothetical protein